MTKFNQAVLAAVSSIALFGGALALITPSAEAKNPKSVTDGKMFRNGDHIVEYVAVCATPYKCVSIIAKNMNCKDRKSYKWEGSIVKETGGMQPGSVNYNICKTNFPEYF